jgi:phosphohistidine phosphatase SixA
MDILVVRHGLSDANNRESLAFGQAEAGLMLRGRDQAAALGSRLHREYNIDPKETNVAVSEFRRTYETATRAGFNRLIVYPTLNEVSHGMELVDLRMSLDEGRLPSVAIENAVSILENPPDETVWVTHGLVIAGLCAALGIYQSERLIPQFCEVRKLSF